MHLVKVDAYDEANDDYTDAANITGLPSFLLYDGSGELIGRWGGYGDAETFLARQDGFLAEPMSIDARRERFQAEPSYGDALLLWAAARSTDSWDEALHSIQQADALRAEGTPDHDYDIFVTYLAAAMDEAAELEPTLAAADAALASPETTEEEQLKVARYLGYLDEQLENNNFASEYRARVLKATSGSTDPDIVRARNVLLVEKALEEGNKPAAAQYKRATYEAGWEEDAQKLNSFAWWSFENEVELEDAEKIAAKGVELAEPGSQRAMILDTQAEIAFKLGKADEAIALIEKAIEDDPDGDMYKNQLARFKGEDEATE
ncbi:MAG: hypothetical protein V2I33_24545 [Kangiellaceae bacterium]|nr:hypothetical protein [Kangiellaceae bacterium]